MIVLLKFFWNKISNSKFKILTKLENGLKYLNNWGSGTSLFSAIYCLNCECRAVCNESSKCGYELMSEDSFVDSPSFVSYLTSFSLNLSVFGYRNLLIPKKRNRRFASRGKISPYRIYWKRLVKLWRCYLQIPNLTVPKNMK